MSIYSSKDSTTIFRDYPVSEDSSSNTSNTSSETSDSEDEDDESSWYCINPSCDELKFDSKFEWVGHVITKHPSLKHIYLLQSDQDWYYRQTPIMFERELEKIEKKKKIKKKRLSKINRRKKNIRGKEKKLMIEDVDDDDREDNLYYCFYNDCMTSSGYEREVDFICHVYAQHPENIRLFTKKQKEMYRKEIARRRIEENLGVGDISPSVTPRTIKPTPLLPQPRVSKREEKTKFSPTSSKMMMKKEDHSTPSSSTSSNSLKKRRRNENGIVVEVVKKQVNPSNTTTTIKSKSPPVIDPQERKKEIIRDYKIRRKIKYAPPKDMRISTNSLELLSTDPMEVERFGEIEGFEELEFEEHGEIQDTDRTVRGVKSEMSKIRYEINKEVQSLKFVDDKMDEMDRRRRRRRKRRRKRHLMRRIASKNRTK